jgi:hypothetical protein
MAQRNLSKSKLIAYRQCAKRVWLEVHKPELRKDSASAEARMEAGNELGRLARQLYDPDGTGVLIDAQKEGFGQALKRSKKVLANPVPIFEAGFAANGGIAFADVMVPVSKRGAPTWRMVEVKSSTSVKGYHREDAAIQAYIARAAGVDLEAIAVAHIDGTWVYDGDGDYHGLLAEVDLTELAGARALEVETWIDEAQEVVAQKTEPAIQTGPQCSDPFDCGFIAHCKAGEPQAKFPVGWLPRVQKKAVQDFIETKSIKDLSDVPDEYLNEVQRRVKAHTISGTPYFDKKGAARALAAYPLPAQFLDFETAQLAIPRWKGMRPYQQIPFQFSLHKVDAKGTLDHVAYLETSGDDPSRAFAQALIAECTGTSPVFVYNAGFENGRIKELAERLPALREALLAISTRIVDLLPIARAHYYHPAQHGSWSIKYVLPAVAPDLSYDKLDGVKDGGMAMTAYFEATSATTSPARREEIRRQLLDYCKLDTYAMVRLWQVFADRTDLKL